MSLCVEIVCMKIMYQLRTLPRCKNKKKKEKKVNVLKHNLRQEY